MDDSPALSPEEQALVDTVNEHDTIDKDQAIQAAELMVVESRRLPPGEYSLVSIAKMFLDCADRVITSPSPAAAASHSPVSYTHLTLPTILRV